MNLQESIRRILREELSSRVRRRIDPDEMEKEFLESFDYAYKIKKRTKVSPTDFLDELIYRTISMMMDGFHWRFDSTLPEGEFWYADIHTELENHYRDRITQMYNERRGINESILREETKLPAYIRRRVNADDLNWLVRDVKISLSRGKNKSDALYDAIQNLISSNKELLKDYDMFQDVYAFDEPLIRYINSKLDEEPLNESILSEETSSHNGNESRRKKVFYGFQGLPNFWSDDYDRVVKDSYFDDKDYNDYYFDNFYDMDKEFGHKKSLFGTKGLPVGHPNRSSKSFDMYNDQYGPAIVRVVEDTDLQKQEQNEGELTEKCWPGYTQKGMKTMFGKRYPNCVKKKKK